MTTPADRTIAALRTGHDDLAAKVALLTPEGLHARSGASEWNVATVLSHLGSGAEIHLAMLERQLDGAADEGPDANQRIWDRWNAMSPADQADSFLKANALLVDRYEAMDEATRADQLIDMGFLPAPVDVATAAGFRLNEFTHHSWDVAVAADPTARLAQDAVEQLLDIAPLMLGWLGKPDVLDGREVDIAVTLTDLGREFGLHLDDAVLLVDTPAEAAATLSLPSESWLRLLYGRLGPAYTPGEVTPGGAITLDELRQVFPGF